MVTAHYLPLPSSRDMLSDIDGCDNAYSDSQCEANERDPRRAVTPTDGPEQPRIPLIVTDERVRSLITHAKEHTQLRLAAWHPLAPAEWIASLAQRSPSVTTCDLVHAVLSNAHANWDALRTLRAGHRHDPAVYSEGYPRITLPSSTCDEVTLAASVLRNRAAPPDLVADAIRIQCGTARAHTGGRGAWWNQEHPYLLFYNVIQQANATPEDITEFVETVMGTDSGRTSNGSWIPYEIAATLDQLSASGGYVFGDYKESNAGGRIGCLDRWATIRLIAAALADPPPRWGN